MQSLHQEENSDGPTVITKLQVKRMEIRNNRKRAAILSVQEVQVQEIQNLNVQEVQVQEVQNLHQEGNPDEPTVISKLQISCCNDVQLSDCRFIWI